MKLGSLPFLVAWGALLLAALKPAFGSVVGPLLLLAAGLYGTLIVAIVLCLCTRKWSLGKGLGCALFFLSPVTLLYVWRILWTLFGPSRGRSG